MRKGYREFRIWFVLWNEDPGLRSQEKRVSRNSILDSRPVYPLNIKRYTLNLLPEIKATAQTVALYSW
jgi:hypothetical protein